MALILMQAETKAEKILSEKNRPAKEEENGDSDVDSKPASPTEASWKLPRLSWRTSVASVRLPYHFGTRDLACPAKVHFPSPFFRLNPFSSSESLTTSFHTCVTSLHDWVDPFSSIYSCSQAQQGSKLNQARARRHTPGRPSRPSTLTKPIPLP
jgi:hypothetical protein